MLDWLKRLGLRWVLLYLVLSIFDSNASFVLGTATVAMAIGNIPDPFAILGRVVSWVGEHVLHLTQLNGAAGGDIVSMLGLALAGAVLWTCLDRDRQRERVCYEATRVLVRYGLAAVMLDYGFDKVFDLQFSHPQPSLLLKPFGDLSPAALMWAFVGSSTLYTIFAGLGEAIGGALLLFRRTTTLGALVIAGVMTNVVVMDTAYQAGVGLVIWSSQLLFQAIFLMVPDLLRLAPALLLDRSAPAANVTRAWPKDWMAPTSRVLKVLVIGLMLSIALGYDYRWFTSFEAAQKMELVGLYRVEHFSGTGKNDPLRVSDGKLWQRVAIEPHLYSVDGRGFDIHEIMAVRTADDVIQYFPLQIDRIDATHGRFILMGGSGDTHPVQIVFRYVVVHHPAPPGSPPPPSNEVLALDGNVDGGTISMQLSLDRLDMSNFELTKHTPSMDDVKWPNE